MDIDKQESGSILGSQPSDPQPSSPTLGGLVVAEDVGQRSTDLQNLEQVPSDLCDDNDYEYLPYVIEASSKRFESSQTPRTWRRAQRSEHNHHAQ